MAIRWLITRFILCHVLMLCKGDRVANVGYVGSIALRVVLLLREVTTGYVIDLKYRPKPTKKGRSGPANKTRDNRLG